MTTEGNTLALTTLSLLFYAATELRCLEAFAKFGLDYSRIILSTIRAARETLYVMRCISRVALTTVHARPPCLVTHAPLSSKVDQDALIES